MIRSAIASILWASAAMQAAAECPAFAPNAAPGETVIAELEPFMALGMMGFRDAEDASDIWRFPDLPDGGIDAQHLCDPARVVPFADGQTWATDPTPDQNVLAISTLLLRDGVDYDATYPEAFAEGRARGQFFEFPGGQVAIVRFGEDTVPAIADPELNALIEEHSNCPVHSMVIVGDSVVIPTC